MLAAERHKLILDALRIAPAVRVTDLASAFNVSEMTVRRDIEQLAENRLLRKVHGGASRLGSPGAEEPEFSTKAGMHREAKRAIAAEALSLIEPGMTIALGAGSTVHQLALLLSDVGDISDISDVSNVGDSPARLGGLTIITNSLRAAEALDRPGIPHTVILTGGERTVCQALVGPLAVTAITALHADLCFLGAHGVHPRGLSSPNLTEAQTNRAFVEACDRLIVLADHSKFGTHALASFAALDQVSTLITDPPGPAAACLEPYREAVAELRTVAPISAHSAQVEEVGT